ncbi:MAG TPA: ATP-binding protein [Blastocatellia bacterium]|nr:ATP-binding protein [Blastocatellia bacterium]
MDRLDSYVRSDYKNDKTEIERAHTLLETTLPIFRDFFIGTTDGGKWPYQIVDYRHPDAAAIRAVAGPGATYSASTNTMILFALAVAAGHIRSSPLVPATRASFRSRQTDRLVDLIKRALNTLQVHLQRDTKFVITSATWGEDDPLTLTWLIQILSSLQGSRDPKVTSWIGSFRDMADALIAIGRERIQAAVQNPARPVLAVRAPSQALEHTFPVLRLVQLYEALRRLSKAPDVDLSGAGRYFTDRLHQQLSLSAIPSANFDVAELVFSLEGALLCGQDAPSIDTLSRSFDVITERQAISPYWRPVRPLVVTPRGQIHLPLSVEIANSLLRICAFGDDELSSALFSKHLGLFKRYVDWVKSRIVRGEADTFATPTSRKSFTGWPSEHTDSPRSIHPWQTSQILLFFAHYSSLLQQHIADSALRAANFSGASPNRLARPSREACEALTIKYDPAPTFADNSPYRVYRRLCEEYVLPRIAHSFGELQSLRHFSMLLYGPPGTAKTTAAEELARILGYRLIQITPSDFIAEGEAEVEARAKVIFQTLREQSSVVILFDEIDRLLLDRDSVLYQDQSDIFQFMTPGMLTKLRDLRDQEEPIFIIATNYAERIDRAVKRPGRIDDRYLLLPPDREQRASILRHLIKAILLNPGAIADADLTTALAPVISETPLFVYSELKRLVRDALPDPCDLSCPEIIDRLKTAKLHIDPTITLASYRTRFRAGLTATQPLATVEEPFEEFLLLVHLVLQSRVLREDEWDLVDRIVRSGKEVKARIPVTELTSTILRDIKDASVRTSLLGRFRERGLSE